MKTILNDQSKIMTQKKIAAILKWQAKHVKICIDNYYLLLVQGSPVLKVALGLDFWSIFELRQMCHQQSFSTCFCFSNISNYRRLERQASLTIVEEKIYWVLFQSHMMVKLFHVHSQVPILIEKPSAHLKQLNAIRQDFWIIPTKCVVENKYQCTLADTLECSCNRFLI